MAVLDAPLRKVSVALINKFGKSITLTYTSVSAYVPGTRKPTTDVTAVTVKAIIEAVGLRGAPGSGRWANVLTGDQQVTIAAKGLATAPKAKDSVTIDGSDYEVVAVNPVYTGDQAAIYELHARR